MESLLSSKFFEAEVVYFKYLSPEILQLTFRSDLHKMEFYPGWALMIRIGDNDLRHYTMSTFDPHRGLFDILFHIHGGGPGSNLAASLNIGDKIKMAVPGGPKMFDRNKQHHFFFGDETSLSFIQILIDEINRQSGSYIGIIELREENKNVLNEIGIKATAVLPSHESPGKQTIEQIIAMSNAKGFNLEKYIFYLTGNVNSLQALRKELKAMGVSSKNIKIQGYWKQGIAGL